MPYGVISSLCNSECRIERGLWVLRLHSVIQGAAAAAGAGMPSATDSLGREAASAAEAAAVAASDAALKSALTVSAANRATTETLIAADAAAGATSSFTGI